MLTKFQTEACTDGQTTPKLNASINLRWQRHNFFLFLARPACWHGQGLGMPYWPKQCLQWSYTPFFLAMEPVTLGANKPSSGTPSSMLWCNLSSKPHSGTESIRAYNSPLSTVGCQWDTRGSVDGGRCPPLAVVFGALYLTVASWQVHQCDSL